MDDLETELEGGLAKAAHNQLLHEAELQQAAAEVAELCRMLYETFPGLVHSVDSKGTPPLPDLAIAAPDLLELQVCFPVPLAPCSSVAVQAQ